MILGPECLGLVQPHKVSSIAADKNRVNTSAAGADIASLTSTLYKQTKAF